MIDNGWYCWSRVGVPFSRRFFDIITQCYLFSFNRASLRDGTFLRRLLWFFRGVKRAVANRRRLPALGFVPLKNVKFIAEQK